MADDEVVQNGYVEQPAGGDRLRRQVQIVRTGLRIPRWVVVHHDESRRVLPHRVAEEFADAHQGGGDVADGEGALMTP